MPLKTIATLLAILCLAGCAPRGPNVAYGDPGAVETVTNEFSSNDMLVIAQSMTNSMLQSPVIADGSRPILTVSDVRNKTSEYIDTSAITNTIRTQLVKSGAVRFGTDIAGMQGQVDELQRQNQSGLYAPSTTARVGNMQAAKYRLTGSIGSIVKRGDGVKDVFYQFDLSLVNIETGLIEWEDQKDIRKVSGG